MDDEVSMPRFSISTVQFSYLANQLLVAVFYSAKVAKDLQLIPIGISTVQFGYPANQLLAAVFCFAKVAKHLQLNPIGIACAGVHAQARAHALASQLVVLEPQWGLY